MALIAELGAAEGNERWVKEGAALGHFVIHEIRRDGIVYRDGRQLREMAVEHYADHPRLARDLRPGGQRVSAAVEGVGIVPAAPAGPPLAGRSPAKGPAKDTRRTQRQEGIGGCPEWR